MNNIDSVIEKVLIREGGFVIDHAGPTNFGITIPSYEEFLGVKVNKNDIEKMTKEMAIRFYKWLFDKQKVSQIENIDTMDILFDSMVNHGNVRAIKWAQKICKVKDDGILGPVSIAAINSKPKEVYYSILVERIKLYTYLATENPDKYQKFLKGWINRACDFIKEI